MQFVNKHALLGLLSGALLTMAGVAAFAHAGGSDAHRMQSADRLSITGSPAELAQRAHDLSLHICENIEAVSHCPVTPAADEAAKELNAMQAGYQSGQERMHDLLTSSILDREEMDRVQIGQSVAVQAGAKRYMRFLGDAATALTPEQRQMFSRQEHAAQ